MSMSIYNSRLTEAIGSLGASPQDRRADEIINTVLNLDVINSPKIGLELDEKDRLNSLRIRKDIMLIAAHASNIDASLVTIVRLICWITGAAVPILVGVFLLLARAG